MLKGKIVMKEKGYGVIEAEDGREISFRTPSIRSVSQ